MTTNTWIRATLICGALDAAYASVTALLRGKPAGPVWNGVAAGPFGDAAQGWGTGGIAAGLLVHFAIMGVMAAFFLWVVWRNAWVRKNAVLAGALYGLLLFVFMYYGVLNARFGLVLTDPVKVAIGLFPHIFFVGIPMALIARSATKPS
jgi:hypothetical protein